MRVQIPLECGYLWSELKELYNLSDKQTNELFDAVHYEIEAEYDFQTKTLTLI